MKAPARTQAWRNHGTPHRHLTRSLPPGEIHLWLTVASELADPALLDTYAQLLSPEELSRQSAYRFARDRHRALVTRAFLRTLLSHYRPAMQPQAWRFRTNAQGKPYIAEPDASIGFNLSHSGDVIVCALAHDRPVGVDIERISRVGDARCMADQFFTEPERHSVHAAGNAAARAQRFCELWTLKESFIKALGSGLSLPLDKFSFDIEASGNNWINDAITLSCAPNITSESITWRSWLMYPDTRHRIAVTVGDTSPAAYRFTFIHTQPLRHIAQIDFDGLRERLHNAPD